MIAQSFKGCRVLEGLEVPASLSSLTLEAEGAGRENVVIVNSRSRTAVKRR
jgi:hypothetical protein